MPKIKSLWRFIGGGQSDKLVHRVIGISKQAEGFEIVTTTFLDQPASTRTMSWLGLLADFNKQFEYVGQSPD